MANLHGRGAPPVRAAAPLSPSSREAVQQQLARALFQELARDETNIKNVLPLILNAARTQEPSISEGALRKMLLNLLLVDEAEGRSSRPTPPQVDALLGSSSQGQRTLKSKAFPGEARGATGGDALVEMLLGLSRR